MLFNYPNSMNNDRELTNLEQLLDLVSETTDDSDEVSLGEILLIAGPRSFGSLLLVTGVIILAPFVGDIPGVPTAMGLLVFLIAVQLLLQRNHFWFPDWMLNRSVDEEKIRKALEWLRPPAEFVDRFLRPRLNVFTEGPALFFIAGACILIAAVMPAMEFIPFSANAAGVALTAFGLSLIAHDGLLALMAFLFTAVSAGLVVYNIF